MKKIDYKTYSKPSDFMHFEQGNTTIRIISSGALIKKHGMRTAHEYVPLGDCTETPECEFCLKGNEPKQKWVWICVDIKNGLVKILDVGPMVGDRICQISQEKGKDPQEFDIVITRTGLGLKSKYTAEAGQVSQITVEELAKYKNVKQFLIKKYFKSNN